jgi:Xaa-Pro aminopeptidase
MDETHQYVVARGIEHVQSLLAQHEMLGVLIVAPTDLHYITGISLSKGMLFITSEKAYLFIDPRYRIATKTLVSDVEIFCSASTGDMLSSLELLLKGPIGFDATTLTVEKFQELSAVASPGQFIAAPNFFSHLRRPKRLDEIRAIQEACALCEQGFNYLLGEIREGVTEQQLAGALKAFWFAHGAEAISFEPIIAFGPHSACPHWTSSATPLLPHSQILIDIGVKSHSYHSDMTRTIFFGRPDPEMLVCHALVQEAYMLALEEAKPGASPIMVDAAARQYLVSKGYGEAFVHGLGHGVGLEVHEPPRISAYAIHEYPLELGDVITIEPGIYLEGRGGIRIENTVVIEASGARSFFSVPLQPVFL